MFHGTHLYVCGVENYVLRYKPVCYKVKTDYVERIQYSVFSFFSLLLPLSV